MADKFKSGDRVFAKIKGWPPWPARVLSRAEGKAEAYNIQFYGTYDLSTVKPDSMYPYNEDNKAKYGKPKGTSRWKEAMEEIESNTPIGDLGEEDDINEEVPEPDPDTDDGDGELMIDEGPSQPPVLTKEVGKSSIPTPQNGKSTPAPPKGRRGSKASLSKRDSISSTASSSAEVSTPAPSASGSAPATELVSRSGRKIKPKRFADDEIPSTPTPTKPKAAPAGQEEGSDGPPNKRAKRGGKTPPTATASPAPPEPPKEPTRARIVIGKGKGAPGKSTPMSSGRLSPDILAPVPKAPALKPAAHATSVPPQRRSADVGPPGKKPLPALIPASAPAAPAATHPAAASAQAVSTRRAPALRQQRQEVIEDEELEEVEAPPDLLNAEEAEAGADDKENLKDSAASSNGSEVESESEVEKNSEMDDTSSRYSEAFDENLTRIPFTDKEGEAFEIRIETRQEFETEEERAEYDAGISTMVKIKEDLEQGDQDTHETLQELLEASKEDFESEEAIQRERRASQIRTLRVEGEVIEIIGEIVSCLGEKQAECYRALELLERLGSHDLTALILKKHPEVVQTVGRLRNYVGNMEQWDMTEDQTIEFKESATAIRLKAQEIYSSFYTVFIPPEEQDQTVPFEEIFKEEMKVFKEMTQDLTLDEVLGLTAESEGSFEVFDVDGGEMV